MQIGNCRLLIADNGSDIALNMVTPAEVAVLGKLHTSNAKKWPIHSLVIIEEREAASIAIPEEIYTSDEFSDNGKIRTHKIGDVKKAAIYRARTAAEEIERLKTKYHNDVIDAMFPGLTPNVPLNFADVKQELPQTQTNVSARLWSNESTVPVMVTPVSKNVKLNVPTTTIVEQ